MTIVKKLLRTDRSNRIPSVANHRQHGGTKEFLVSFMKRRLANKEEAAIYATISYLGVKTGPFSTGQFTKWNAFNVTRLEIEGDSEKSALLADLRTRAKALFANCRLVGRPVDVYAIRDALFADDQLIGTTPNIQQAIDNWLAYDYQRYETGEIVQRTMWKNRRWSNDFRAYVIHKHGQHARLSDLKAADIRAYVIWLKQSRHLSNNVAQATASHAKVILNYALDHEWINRNPFITFRRKMDEVVRETLDEEEIKLLCTFKLASKPLEIIRDVFFFMCLTGLSYADLERLRQHDIKTSPKGEKYIHIKRRKMLSRDSSVPAIIPLTTSALDLLAKYQPETQDEQLLPLQANAPLNRSLKQIAFMCGLEKSISTKVARNSLATYLLNNGVPLSSVSALLGHSSTITTQKFYAKVSPSRVIKDIGILNDQLKSGLFGME